MPKQDEMGLGLPPVHRPEPPSPPASPPQPPVRVGSGAPPVVEAPKPIPQVTGQVKIELGYVPGKLYLYCTNTFDWFEWEAPPEGVASWTIGLEVEVQGTVWHRLTREFLATLRKRAGGIDWLFENGKIDQGFRDRWKQKWAEISMWIHINGEPT